MSDPSAARELLLEEMSRRVRPLCPDVPAAELAELLARIVEAELAHRTRAGQPATAREDAAAANGR